MNTRRYTGQANKRARRDRTRWCAVCELLMPPGPMTQHQVLRQHGTSIDVTELVEADLL
jgi:hypothetical protein